MRFVDAVYKRIIELCKKNNMSLYRLTKISAIPYSTIATMRRSKTVELSTINGVCKGLKISLATFFSSELFLDYTY